MRRNHPPPTVVGARVIGRAVTCLALVAAGCAGQGTTAARPPTAPVEPAHTISSAAHDAGGVLDGASADASLAEGASAAEVRTPGRLEYRSEQSLAGIFDALARAEARRGDGRAAIVQLGDSHTEDGSFTGRMRARLQTRFGDAGRGFLSPGVVHHFAQRDATIGADPGWTVERMMTAHHDGPLGLAGLRAHTDVVGASVWFGTCARCQGAERASRFELFYRASEGATLAVRLDDGPWRDVVRAEPAGEAPAAERFHIVSTDDGPHRVSVRTSSPGTLDLFGASMERDVPGVVVDSLGVVGARAAHLHHLDWSVLSEQLTHRDPSLVVLQFGTNEATERTPDLARIERELTELVTRVRTAAPRASVLLLGPPDMARRAPLTADITPGTWQTPPLLLTLVELQRRVARATDVVFFDSLTALGGPERIDAMVRATPPEAWPDHIHLTPRGYARWADLVVDDLLARYDARPARR